MTREISEILDRCTESAKKANADDLIGLAQLHSDLQAILQLNNQQPSDHPELPCAKRAADLVEKLVLNELEDKEMGVSEIGRQILELQTLLRGDAPAMATSPAEPAAKPAPAPKPATAAQQTVAAPKPAIAEERVIAEGDAPLALEFVGEAVGHLDAAEASLLKLEEDPNDTNEVNAVFRAFHTIKGVAGFLELKQIGALAHAAETLLDLARKGKVQLIGPRLDVVLEARDLMRQMVSAVENAAKTVKAPLRQDGLEPLLDRLNEAAKENGNLAPATEKTAAPRAAAAPESSQAPASIPEAPKQPGAAQQATNAQQPTPSPKAPAAQQSSVPPSQSSSTGGDAVVKVATGRLDALINTVGELVIAQLMVAQDIGSTASDQRLGRNLSHLGKITRGLQELAMSMRMVPIQGVFQKMARLARDVGRKAAKEVEFIQIGGETELDRNVVEAISDPLVHMVRNAIDHGLEYPEERLKAGKPREGKLTLMACHQSGNVVIQITDDGRGLNQKRIVEKAIAAGLVKEGQELSEQQIFQLVFHPGLSTAEKVTDISGRGVGMDVVKKNVEALRGRCEIASTPGKGSTFTVRLPLTLAVIDGLIVMVGAQRYIVPITSIEQSIRPTAKQLSTIQNKGEMCMVREKLLPMVRLHRLFNIKPKTEDATAALVVIVQEGTSRCCILVDELIGQQQVVIKSVGKEIGNLPGIAGCAILGDGNVSLILDVAGIIHSALR
jgi:two-component system, chemotaxis family, sensor kinase CheA